MVSTVAELEDKIIGSEVTETYTVRHGPDAGKEVSYTTELDWVELMCTGSSTTIDVPEVGQLRNVASFGGEGSGDEAWVVIGITDASGEEKLYRKDGYYASFHGFDFDGRFYKVQPVQRLVTFYEAV